MKLIPWLKWRRERKAEALSGEAIWHQIAAKVWPRSAGRPLVDDYALLSLRVSGERRLELRAQALLRMARVPENALSLTAARALDSHFWGREGDEVSICEAILEILQRNYAEGTFTHSKVPAQACGALGTSSRDLPPIALRLGPVPAEAPRSDSGRDPGPNAPPASSL